MAVHFRPPGAAPSKTKWAREVRLHIPWVPLQVRSNFSVSAVSICKNNSFVRFRQQRPNWHWSKTRVSAVAAYNG